MAAETEPAWEHPKRRGRRCWWPLAATVAAAAAGAALAWADRDHELPVEERDEPPAPQASLGEAPWALHPDPDHVRAVAAAPDGGVWAGTHAGALVRWGGEGRAAEVHRPAADLAGRSLRSLAVGRDGVVWTGGSFGVARFADGEWTTRPGDGAPGHRVPSVAVDHEGAVWAATSRGLWRFDGDEWEVFRGGGLPQRWVTTVAVDARGAVWSGTRGHEPDDPRGGLWRFDGEEWTAWGRADGLADVRALAPGADGSMWALAETPASDPEAPAAQRLLRFDGDEVGWTTVAGPDRLPAGRLASLSVGADGTPWVAVQSRPAGSGEAVARFDGDGWTTFTTADGLPHGRITSLAVDAAGAPWAATAGGLARFDGAAWRPRTSGAGPIGDSVTSVAVDADDRVWAATAGTLARPAPAGRRLGGLARFDGRRWQRWTADDGLAHDRVTSVAVAPDGAVWAGTAGGVSRFAGGEWTTWTAESDDGLAHDRVLSLAVGGDGAVWAATGDFDAAGEMPAADGGLARFDGQRWTSWTGGPLADGRLPLALATGEGGAVWAGLRDGSVARFDGSGWEIFTHDDGLPGAAVLSLATDPGATVWAGTSEGVVRYDGRRWAGAGAEGNPLRLDRDDQVAHRAVEALAVEAGTVWVATRGGLARFDGWTWEAAPLDEAPVLIPRSLAVGDTSVWLGTASGLVGLDRPASRERR